MSNEPTSFDFTHTGIQAWEEYMAKFRALTAKRAQLRKDLSAAIQARIDHRRVMRVNEEKLERWTNMSNTVVRWNDDKKSGTFVSTKHNNVTRDRIYEYDFVVVSDAELDEWEAEWKRLCEDEQRIESLLKTT